MPWQGVAGEERVEESATAQQRAISILGGHITGALREAAEVTQAAMRLKLAEYVRHCGVTRR